MAGEFNGFSSRISNEKYSEAIAVAEESLKLSIEVDNRDYIKMNKESILEWTNKL